MTTDHGTTDHGGKRRAGRHLTPAQWLPKPAPSRVPQVGKSLRETWSPRGGEGDGRAEKAECHEVLHGRVPPLVACRNGPVWPNSKAFLLDLMRDAGKDSGAEWKHNALRHSFISYRVAKINNRTFWPG